MKNDLPEGLSYTGTDWYTLADYLSMLKHLTATGYLDHDAANECVGKIIQNGIMMA